MSIMDEARASRLRRIADYYIPEGLWFKKVVANMECYDEESFKWAVTGALHPVDKNPQWITTNLRCQVEEYNWDGLSFPTPLSEIETFERNNDVLVNVFKWDETTKRATPIRVPFGKHDPRALLILIDEDKGHYVVIKSMQGLFRKQTGKGGRMFYCNNCMTLFFSDEFLQRHVACCDRLEGSPMLTNMPMVMPKLKLKPKSKLRPNAGEVNLRAATSMVCCECESFKWAVVRALNPVDRNSGRVTKTLVEQSKKYNWFGVSFPTTLKDVAFFEKMNNILVNVFRFDREGDRVRPVNVSMGKYEGRALLVLVDGCYKVVKTISRLLGGQTAKGKRHCKRYFCDNCLKSFTSKLECDEHITRLCEFVPISEGERGSDIYRWSLRSFRSTVGEGVGNFCEPSRTFSDDEQEDDFNDYLARKFNDDS